MEKMTPQKTLVREFGLNRNQFAALRDEHLPKSEIKKAGREIHITQKGVEMLRAAIKMTPDDDLSLSGSGGQDNLEKTHGGGIVQDPEWHQFTVHNVTTNPHIILAHDGKRLVRIRVRHNRHWRRGMPIRATHLAGDLYELVGRSPRYDGRF